MSESLKKIVESFENKLLNKYIFDRNAVKKGTICANCEYYKNGYCSLLKDKVNSKYTCNKFERKEDDKEKE